MTRRQLAVLVGLGVVVAAWCSLGVRVRATYGARLTADEPQYVLSAISLAEDRDLDISDELHDERWRAFHSPAQLPVQTKVLDGGRQISPHDPLLPALLAVPVALAGWMGAKVALALMAGALAALVAWTAWRRFDVPFGLAVGGTALFAMSPPLAMYATQVYPELPAALVVAGCVAVLTAPRGPNGRTTAAVVALVVALPWLSVKYAPVTLTIAAVAAWQLWRAGRRDLLVRAGVALVGAGVAYAVFHQAVYGGWTPYAAGDHFVGGEATVMGVDVNLAGRARRLIGLLVDRDFGLVPWQPAYLLLVPALSAAFGEFGSPWRTQVTESRRGFVVLVLPLLAGWLTATFVALTMQGWWWPGRQVVVVLPCAVLLVLVLAARHRAAAIALVALGAAGVVEFLWLMVEGLRHRLTLVVDFATTTDPLFRVWRHVLPDGRVTTDAAVALTAAWGAAALSVLVWRSRARLVTATAAALVVVVLAAGAIRGWVDDGAGVRNVGAIPGVGRPDE
ncbi:MAG TPA: hypothetical protein VFK42_05585 [Acidimicrobiales bacterium]|nr:hypothetical protein [Acidimicrobiales bacterium]